ncbi:MAG: DUF58 domain-containing protein [Actinomycetota bacterium]|nr:DUF58 domain-containing protein [Actinomycetota bacterium]
MNRRTALRASGWGPTAAHARATWCGFVLAGAAVLGHRPDLLVLAAPFVGAAVWAALLRPTTPLTVHQSMGHPTLSEGDATTWRFSVDDPGCHADDIAVRLRVPEWIVAQPADGAAAAGLRDDGDRVLDIGVRATRWGRHRVGPARVVASSAWAGFQWVSESGLDARSLLTLPRTTHFDATAGSVHRPGLIGVNRSPRQSAGTEFASIRPFQPGDRLRRIHWSRSLRTGTLHVTSTWADHDRHVVLLVEGFDDIGRSEGIDGSTSSLDLTLRAAGSIAEHFLEVGDRVALVVLDNRGIHRLPAAGGSRHLRRLLETLSTTDPTGRLNDTGRVPRGLHPGALVVMLSPLASPTALERAVTMAAHGRSVVVVDCLPRDITQQFPGDPLAGVAWRIRSLERALEIERAGESGVAVVQWRGPGSLDQVLRNMRSNATERSQRPT